MERKKFLLIVAVLALVILLFVAIVPFVSKAPGEEEVGEEVSASPTEEAPPPTVEEVLRVMTPPSVAAEGEPEVSEEIRGMLQLMSAPANTQARPPSPHVDAVLKQMILESLQASREQ